MEKFKLVGTLDTSHLTKEEYHTFARLLRKVRVTSIKMLSNSAGSDAEATKIESDQEGEQSMETGMDTVTDARTENKNNRNHSAENETQTQGPTAGDYFNDDLPDIGSLKLVFEPSDDFWAAGRKFT